MPEKSDDLLDWKADLRNTDLVIDQYYRGGRNGNAGDDPMNALLGVSNQGGFRILGTKQEPRLVVLMTSLNDPEWPDYLDHEQGTFTYYGDNKTPGKSLHKTARFGNNILQNCFALAHGDSEERQRVPPFLAFATLGQGTYRDVRFLGLLVPGAPGVPENEDLVAVWKTSKSTRFQNYRAVFSVLDTELVERSWLKQIQAGQDGSQHEPQVLRAWRETGNAKLLKAPNSQSVRSKKQQLPESPRHRSLLSTIRTTFSDDPTRFEQCAARLVELELKMVTRIEVTRSTRDGGRDAKGLFRVGSPGNGIELSFSVEAKCYSETNSVGVKEVSRLISRLRHREFGVIVTTSFVADQAYRELVEDKHPVIVVSAVDIARILDENGLGNVADLKAWLQQFP